MIGEIVMSVFTGWRTRIVAAIIPAAVPLTVVAGGPAAASEPGLRVSHVCVDGVTVATVEAVNQFDVPAVGGNAWGTITVAALGPVPAGASVVLARLAVTAPVTVSEWVQFDLAGLGARASSSPLVAALAPLDCTITTTTTSSPAPTSTTVAPTTTTDIPALTVPRRVPKVCPSLPNEPPVADCLHPTAPELPPVSPGEMCDGLGGFVLVDYDQRRPGDVPLLGSAQFVRCASGSAVTLPRTGSANPLAAAGFAGVLVLVGLALVIVVRRDRKVSGS